MLKCHSIIEFVLLYVQVYPLLPSILQLALENRRDLLYELVEGMADQQCDPCLHKYTLGNFLFQLLLRAVQQNVPTK